MNLLKSVLVGLVNNAQDHTKNASISTNTNALNLFPFPPQGPWMSPFAMKSVAVHKRPIIVKLIFKFVF